MKYQKLTRILTEPFLLIGILIFSNLIQAGETVGVFYNPDTPQHAFAAGDIKTALEAKDFAVEMKALSSLSKKYQGKKVVIALASNQKIARLLKEQHGNPVNEPGEQAFALRTTIDSQKSYWILGGDDNGAMYGGLQIAENISFHGFEREYNEADSPHLKNRGIKFNIPLDKKAPTYYYSTDAQSHKIAIAHVWDMDFWKTWFDEMARHRYNILSLWSPHPFTSMLNMEDEYPGIAIQGVAGYGENDETIQINDLTIDEKIEFWQKVMKYGTERGFGIYFCTWNIFLTTAEGKHGLTHHPDNQKTKVYFKKCMIRFLETYPDLAGFGITVGERMGQINHKEREEWAWETYGMGMLEYAQAHPDRDLVFIHRQHDGGLDDILEYFKPLGKLPNVRFDLSFKYSEAHAHTTVSPSRWHRTKMEAGLGPNNLMSWLTVRNDDWYFLHWADPNFVRDYINHFPEIDKFVHAFYIGPDGWVFTKEFTSKNPYYEEKNALSIQRTWYMQKLWGRISYNPLVSDELFKNHLALKFPEVSVARLFAAWSDASGAIRLANEQVTGDWDLDMDWWPEGWTGDAWKEEKGRFFSLEETSGTTPFKGSHLCSLSETAKGECEDRISSWETVDKIDKMARNALDILSTLDAEANTELKLTLKDLKAQANLGLYNAFKFRAVIYVEQGKKNEALGAIGSAYCYWKNYTNLMDELYKAVDLQRNLDSSSWHDHDKDALQDYLNLGGEGEPDCTNE
ncbi:hypothetical protein JW964_05015 [candidate division KSB1 bacterium]|nr:hypothetical protein [candidate division KSB1 bacterium]